MLGMWNGDTPKMLGLEISNITIWVWRKTQLGHFHHFQFSTTSLWNKPFKTLFTAKAGPEALQNRPWSTETWRIDMRTLGGPREKKKQRCLPPKRTNCWNFTQKHQKTQTNETLHLYQMRAEMNKFELYRVENPRRSWHKDSQNSKTIYILLLLVNTTVLMNKTFNQMDLKSK